ncbi:hypothetical protein D9M72_373820 [compost metagenome]
MITREGPFHNLVPFEGLNHMLNVTLKGLSQVPTWYIGLFEGDYTPTPDVTAATLPALATECTAYNPATRVEFQEGTVSGGSVDNAAALAEFTFTAGKTVRGSFISSASSKASTSGVLLSVVRFPSPQVMAAGSKLSILAGPTAQPIV